MINKYSSPMNSRWIGIVMLLFLLMGIGGFMQILDRTSQKDKRRQILNKGNYLVSLMALHPLKDLKGDKSAFFLRTLTEYISSEGLVYCFIHDRNGQSLLSLAPHDLASLIPRDIETRSLFTTGLTEQSFKIDGMDSTFYEFAKPIFEMGERSGTVRLGLQAPQTPRLTLERVGLMAIIALLLFAALTFSYYGMTLTFQPLKKLYKSLGIGGMPSMKDPAYSADKAGMVEIIQDLEQSFHQLKDSLTKSETENVEIATRLGVTTYEKNKISRIINSMNFGIIISDIQDNINYINAYMLNLLDMTWNEVVDQPVWKILDQNEITSYLSEQSPGNPGHLETAFPDLVPNEVFRVSLTYMKDTDGSVNGKMITIKNITREKSSEQTKNEFIANVAHEFLTPLTTIKSYNEMLMDEEVDDKEMQKEFYNIISEETNRLSRLIQNLLSISKIEMGSLTLNTGPVKTDLLVEDALAAVEKNAKTKNISIERLLPDRFPTLIGDKDLLQTAIINLLGNAVKYSPENTHITFSLFEQNNLVIFEVTDTGYGISEEDLPHIFDKFYRSNDSNIREQTGTGLGLAMTWEIVHLHGGKIDVQSELGRGTQFTIRIPKEEYYLGKQ